MGFLTGHCCDRWSTVTRCSVGGRGARILDIAVLGPVVALLGAYPSKTPKLIRAGLVLAGAGIIAWNAAKLAEGDVQETPPINLDNLRAAGL